MRRPLLAVLLSLFLSTGALARTAVVEWSDDDSVNVRSAPTTKSKNIVAVLPNGTKVETLREETREGREWTRVKSGAVEGWVVSKSLKALPEAPPQPARVEAKPAPSAPETAPAAAPAEPPRAQAATPPPPQAPAKPYLADSPATEAPPPLDVGGGILTMFSGLLLVLGIIGGIVWALKRYLGGKFPGLSGGNAVRVLTTRPVGPRQALLLIEVGGEVYLIGQTESALTLISKIDQPAALDRLDYLFSFKPSAFEAELRRQVDVERGEEAAPGEGPRPEPAGTPRPPTVEERLAKLRSRFGPSGQS